MKLKKILAFTTSLLLCCGAVSYEPLANFVNNHVTAVTQDDSGSCGENCTYSFDGSTGTLTISGTGDMENYDYTNTTNIPWYSYKEEIKTVIIEDGVTSIGYSAFEDCSSLTSITIPDSITSIGNYAFHGCSSLKSVYFKGTKEEWNAIIDSTNTNFKNTTIHYTIHYNYVSGEPTPADYSGSCGENCTFSFYRPTGTLVISGTGDMENYTNATNIPWYNYNEEIKTVIIEDGVTSIGSKAFCYCSSLTSITIPDSVTEINDYAFSDCRKLTDITIPDSVTEIEDYAFSGCSSLTSITIPDSDTLIGDYAFSGCSSLTSITIPDSGTFIGNYAFSGCSSLTDITILDGVPSIGGYAFSGCSSLTEITIPDSVTFIGDYAFSGCSSLKEITILNGGTSIGNYAFSGCSSLTDITIPNSVSIGASIGNSAFEDCSSLTSITIPDSVTSIGNSAFSGCSSLTSITIPDSVTEINDYAFSGCSSLTNINVDENNRCYSSVDGVLFNKGKTKLIIYPIGNTRTNYTIPDSVTSICDCAFFNCSSLTDITIPNGVTSIGKSAFSGCSSLTDITIPNGVTSIGYSAFSNCSSLTDVYFKGTVKEWHAISIGTNNTPLKNATIHYVGKEPTTADDSGSCGENCTYSFYGSTGTLVISGTGNMKDYYDDDYYNDYYFYFYSIPIPWYYTYREEIKTVIIENSVTSIGSNSFWDCYSLTEIIIPNSVTSIGERAFRNCTNLTDIYFKGTEEEWNAIEIDSSYNTELENATIHYVGEEPQETTTEPKYTTPILQTTTTAQSSENIGTSIGDLNGDDSINVMDLLMLKKYVLKIFTDSDIDMINADLNNDDNVNVIDLLLLKNVVLKIISIDDINS